MAPCLDGQVLRGLLREARWSTSRCCEGEMSSVIDPEQPGARGARVSRDPCEWKLREVPGSPGPALERLGERVAEHPSDLGQQRETKPKGGSGGPRLKRQKHATDSNAEQGLEVEGRDRNLRARRSKTNPSGRVEWQTGWSGESHHPERREGTGWNELERGRGVLHGTHQARAQHVTRHGCERGKTFEG